VPHDPAAFSAGRLLSIRDVAWGDGRWVAVGSVLAERPGTADEDPVVWTSENGFEWTRISSASMAGPGSARMNSVAWNGKVWMAAGSAERAGKYEVALWSSVDARAWTLLDSYPLAATLKPWGEAIAIASSGSYWLLVERLESLAPRHDRQRVWTSEDGTRWRRRPDFVSTPHHMEIRDISWTDDYWLAVGRVDDEIEVNKGETARTETDAGVWVSVNAESWSQIPKHPVLDSRTRDYQMNAVVWLDGRGLAVGWADGLTTAVWVLEDGGTTGGLGRSSPPRSTAPPTTLPTSGRSLPTPEELYGPEAGAACRQEHETLSKLFNQLFEKYGSHSAFPGPGENSDGDRYAAVRGQLTRCLARFGVPPPSY